VVREEVSEETGSVGEAMEVPEMVVVAVSLLTQEERMYLDQNTHFHGQHDHRVPPAERLKYLYRLLEEHHDITGEITVWRLCHKTLPTHPRKSL
jgi:hypothetical protein